MFLPKRRALAQGLGQYGLDSLGLGPWALRALGQPMVYTSTEAFDLCSKRRQLSSIGLLDHGQLN